MIPRLPPPPRIEWLTPFSPTRHLHSSGKDMIPRMSLNSVEQLTEEMLIAAARCKVLAAVVVVFTPLPPNITCWGCSSLPRPHVIQIYSRSLLPSHPASLFQLSKSRLWLQTTLLGTKFKEDDVFKPEEEVHEVGRCTRGQGLGGVSSSRRCRP